jgi:transposase
MRLSREEWSKRVQRWQDSGLSAEQFAAEIGTKAATLKFWKYKLGKAEPVPTQARPLPLVEIKAAPAAAVESRLELDLGGGRRIFVPAEFDAGALKRLIAVLEAT